MTSKRARIVLVAVVGTVLWVMVAFVAGWFTGLRGYPGGILYGWEAAWRSALFAASVPLMIGTLFAVAYLAVRYIERGR